MLTEMVIKELTGYDYYRIENGRLSLTAEGFLLSNEIISILLTVNG